VLPAAIHGWDGVLNQTVGYEIIIQIKKNGLGIGKSSLSPHHLHGLVIQPIEALTGIREVEPLLEEIGIFQPPQGVPYGPGR